MSDKEYQKSVLLLDSIFDLVTVDDVLAYLVRNTKQKNKIIISTVNLNFLRIAKSNVEFRQTIFSSNICTIDGSPVAFLLRAIGIKRANRATGADLLARIISYDFNIARRYKIYIFGGTSDAAKLASEKIGRLSLYAECVGHRNPGHGTVEELSKLEYFDEIKELAPDFLIISLGAEKGQAWISKNFELLPNCAISHLGAAINFIAGSVKRAPRAFQALGLEWVWRIYQEPVLFKRYASDAAFLIQYLIPSAIGSYLRERRYRQIANVCSPVSVRNSETKTLSLHGDWLKDTIPSTNDFINKSYEMDRLDLLRIGHIDAYGIGLILRARNFTGGVILIAKDNPSINIFQNSVPVGMLYIA
jgi:N-acetylglucosaminyldiphosphoundecaprenol N-acetyl-beta-D-mannosaminyltransferase